MYCRIRNKSFAKVYIYHNYYHREIKENNVTDKYTDIVNINLGAFLSEIKPQADGANTL